MPLINRDKIRTLSIGISYRDGMIDTVLFHQQQPQATRFHLSELSDRQSLFNQILTPSLRGKRPYRCQFISAALPHQLWSKTLLLPHRLSATECERQCRYSLQEALPMPLEQVWYDYHYAPLPRADAHNASRLTLFAIAKDTAAQIAAQFPVPLAMLDHGVYALLRACYYLAPQWRDDPQTLWCYQDGSLNLAFQEHPLELRIVQQQNRDLAQLKARFCRRYSAEIRRCVVYRCGAHLPPLPLYWEALPADYPLLALGCALWGQDAGENTAINAAPSLGETHVH